MGVKKKTSVTRRKNKNYLHINNVTDFLLIISSEYLQMITIKNSLGFFEAISGDVYLALKEKSKLRFKG